MFHLYFRVGEEDQVVGIVLPGAEPLIRAVKDRKEQALHKLGMDLHGKNLTREQQNDRIRLTEELNDYTDEEIVEIVRLLQEDDTGVVFLTPEGKKSIITKRTWKQSEERAGSLLPDYDPQRSFLNRKPAAYGEKGSVRPDFYKAGSSIEVKNYDLSSPKRMNNMVHVIAKQFDKRERHIPEGTEQVVCIDILGQNISNEQCLDMIKKIQERTDHKMKVWFLNEKSRRYSMTAPFVGFMVDKTWFHFGWPDYLFSFFSTVTGHLEKHWGERFPIIMNDLCDSACIKKEDAEKARQELRIIREELKAFDPRKLIWDIEHPEKVGPWGVNNEEIRIDEQIRDLSCCFFNEDQINLFDVLDAALIYAQERKADVKLQKYPKENR